MCLEFYDTHYMHVYVYACAHTLIYSIYIYIYIICIIVAMLSVVILLCGTCVHMQRRELFLIFSLFPN